MSEPIFWLLAAAMVVFGLYNVFFLAGLYRISKRSHATGKTPSVSVVIAAKNEGENLKRLIPALLTQDHSNFEIVVALNGTTDSSTEYLAEISQNHAHVRFLKIEEIPTDWNAKKYALSCAIDSAEKELILLTDADCVPSSDQWLTRMAATFSSGTELVLGFSPYSRRKGLLNAFIQFETLFAGIQYLGAASMGLPYMGVGRNLSYRKSFFLQANGFEDIEAVTGGDDDLIVNKNSTRGNTRIQLDRQAITVSQPELTWRDYLHQKTRHFSVARHYNFRSKLFLFLYMVGFAGTWLGLVASLILGASNLLILFGVVNLPLIVCFDVLAKKSGIRYPIHQQVALNIIYPFFHIFVGVRGWLTKRIEWTN